MSLRGQNLYLTFLLILVFSLGVLVGHFTYQPIRKKITTIKIDRKVTQNKDEYVKDFLDKTAPEISTTTLQGEPWSLDNHRGKIIILYFWATYCRACRDQMPILQELVQSYEAENNISFVGVCLDKKSVFPECYCKTEKISWTQLHEEGKGWENSAAQQFHITGIPSLWIINQNGVVKGIDMNIEDTDKKITTMIN